MKFNFKWLIYLPILFFFLPGFSFYMPGLKGLYNFYYISLYISIITIFIFDRKCLINNFLSICKNTPLIYFMIFLLFIVLNSLILSLLGITSITQTIRSFIMQIILGIMPTIIYFMYIIKRHLGLEKFIKIFLLLFWLNLVLSFIAYIGRWFDITFINGFFDFFNNCRLLDLKYSGTAEQTAETYFIKKRLCGLYPEPGSLGQMMFLFFPLVYTFSQTKTKLFKNIFVDKILKRTLIPCSWLTLLLTQSAMSIVYAVIITIIYYFKNILLLLKKYYFIIIPTTLFVVTLILSIDFSDTFVMRIINVVTNIHSFEEFILIEPSLATRVASYVNEFQIFLHHPITGVGIGNVKNYMYQQYLNSPVSLPPEIITRTKFAIEMGNPPMFNPSFIYLILAESGIFAYLIFIYFYFRTFIYIHKLNSLNNNYSLNALLSKSLLFILVVFFLFSFYDLTLKSQYLHFIIALCTVYIYDSKIQLLEEKNA